MVGKPEEIGGIGGIGNGFVRSEVARRDSMKSAAKLKRVLFLPERLFLLVIYPPRQKKNFYPSSPLPLTNTTTPATLGHARQVRSKGKRKSNQGYLSEER